MVKNLRMLRERAGVSQQRVAETVGVSQQSINQYENHKVEPEIETLIRLADYFGTSVDELVGHTQLRMQSVTEEENRMLLQYRQLSDAEKQSILAIMQNYLNR